MSRARMDTKWTRRLLVAALVWVVVFLPMATAGMGPRPALLAGTVAVVAAACWLVVDVGRDVTTVNWVAEATSRSRAGADRRADRLRRSIERTAASDGSLDMLAPLLVDLIDDRVREVHGVARHSHPDRFAEIVGPELDRFVRTAETTPRDYPSRALAAIITRIESL